MNNSPPFHEIDEMLIENICEDLREALEDVLDNGFDNNARELAERCLVQVQVLLQTLTPEPNE